MTYWFSLALFLAAIIVSMAIAIVGVLYSTRRKYTSKLSEAQTSPTLTFGNVLRRTIPGEGLAEAIFMFFFISSLIAVMITGVKLIAFIL